MVSFENFLLGQIQLRLKCLISININVNCLEDIGQVKCLIYADTYLAPVKQPKTPEPVVIVVIWRINREVVRSQKAFSSFR